MVAAAILGGSALSAGASIWGANQAANAQKNAANQAANLQGGIWNTIQGNYQNLAGQVQPFINAGSSFLPTLQSLLTPGSSAANALSQQPGFQFANYWGNKGITNQATMGGLSGNALTAGANYSSGLAQNTYNSVIQNLLSGIGVGTNALNTLGQAQGALGNTGANIGSGIASSITGAGNAAAAGTIGTANAIGGLGGTIGNLGVLSMLTGGNKTGGLFGGNTGTSSNSFPTTWPSASNPIPGFQQ